MYSGAVEQISIVIATFQKRDFLSFQPILESPIQLFYVIVDFVVELFTQLL